MLNSEIAFLNVNDTVRNAFLGKTAQRQFLAPGTKLFKFTHQPLLRADGSVSPWWTLVEPSNPNDPGLTQGTERAEGLGVSASQFARARFAVTRQWNEMSNLVVVQLVVPAYGFYGQCAGQRMDQDEPKVVFIGGGWQIWIPNLTNAHVCLV